MDMKTPGVYIVEKNAFPNSIVPVSTAVPAFIGHTEKAEDGHKSLTNVPFRISSFLEYQQYFGGPFLYKNKVFKVIDVDTIGDVQKKKKDWIEAVSTDKQAKKIALDKARANNSDFKIEGRTRTYTNGTNNDLIEIDGVYLKFEPTLPSYSFYDQIAMYFANGGGSCYIVSVGDYKADFDKSKFKAGIDLLEREKEPTVLVIPEVVYLKETEFYELGQYTLAHCGEKVKNRIAILDIYNGYEAPSSNNKIIQNFRDGIGNENKNYGAAYYPWIEAIDKAKSSLERNSNTLFHLYCTDKTLFDDSKADGSSITHCLHKFELDYRKNALHELGLSNISIEAEMANYYFEIGSVDAVVLAASDKTKNNIIEKAKDILKVFTGNDLDKIKKYDFSGLESSRNIKAEFDKKVSVPTFLPPSAAIAGIYVQNDHSRGVWKAPANISISGIVGPAVHISDEQQEDLNVPNDGKAINAIRYFPGEGTKVWGARTLDGRSNDWRYINVRRTMIFLEQSIKSAARAYVFEPNEANTWVNMRASINNFLYNVWRQGGLAGASPEDAYSVHIGLRESMTPQDILDGVIRVVVLVAISRPSEFIEITFQQQMQKS